MKKISQLLCIGMVLILFFSACSIEKRRYMQGYNIQWNNSKAGTPKNKLVQNDKSGGEDKIVSPVQLTADSLMADETATASADNSTISTKRLSEKPNHPPNALPEECDVIILNNGDEIKVKAYEISRNEIKYKKCGEVNGETYMLKKSEVFMIKKRNGSKDIISPDISAEAKNKPNKNEGTGVFGTISFVSILAAILIFSISVGNSGTLVIISILLVPLAIICGAIGIGKKRKNKGLAIAGLSLGIAAVIFGILLIIALASAFNDNCFSSGTKILMGDYNEVNIEAIKKGDCILTYDFKSSRLIKTEVDRLVTARHSNLFKLTFDEGEITVTSDHPFWVANKGWSSLNPGKSNNNYRQENSIDQLVTGDSLFLPSTNKFTKLHSIQHIAKKQLTYTIELKEGNNFIANGLLVKTEQTIETERKRILTLYNTNVESK